MVNETVELFGPPDTDLRARINHAKEVALDMGKLEAVKDKQDAAVRGFLFRKITLAQLNEMMNRLDEQAGVVKMDDLEEFKEALKIIGFDDETVQAIYQDEESHYREAISQGLIPIPQIQIFLDGSNFGFYPSVGIDLEGLSDDSARNILRAVIQAQKDLSPRDKSQLGIE